jgi:thiamine transport system ATP-binding protein
MIELDRVRYRYDHAEMVFDLTVEPGAFVAVIGPSGAGKTTLLNLIAGFERPDDGRVRLAGTDMTETTPAGRPVTTLFQEHNLFAHLTAAENVGLGLHPGLRLTEAQHRQVDEALETVGLAGLGGRLPREISGGERQRVALARSVVRDRKILLLDEPFAALDPALRQEMVLLVDRLRRDRGLTVVMVTHLLDELYLIDLRAIFIHGGRVLADGRAAELMAAPPTPELAAYLGTPKPD